MQTIGIDPGKKGAVVIMDGTDIKCEVMPLIDKEFDLQELGRLLSSFTNSTSSHGNPHVFIEDVHAIFGSAAGATFTFGFVCGAIQGIVSVLGFPYTLVQPKAWQKVIYQGIPEIRKPSIRISKGKRAGKMMKGKRDTKAMSEVAAKRLFPTVDLRASERCKISHDGIVDALLIAEYGRRTKTGVR